MELSEILAQPEGFTPPSVTVKLEKIYEYKSGQGENGPWSFQTVQVPGGRLKLKGLNELPRDREGVTVTLRANESKQHGLTGVKVNHEQYNGKTYHQLVITSSCKWEFAGAASNGHAQQATTHAAPLDIQGYVEHLLSVAALANQVTTVLGVDDPIAIQACFATLCIDSKNRNVILPKALPGIVEAPVNTPAESGDPYEAAPPPEEFSDDDIPF